MAAWKMFPAWIWALHLMAAVWLSAGVFASAVVNGQMKRTDGDLAGRAFGLQVAWRLMAIFTIPGVVLTGAFGFYLLDLFGMVREASLQTVTMFPGWLKVSIVLYFLLLADILFIQVPHVHTAMRAVEASRKAGAPTPELEAVQRSKLSNILTHVNATVIVFVIFLMAFKPF